MTSTSLSSAARSSAPPLHYGPLLAYLAQHRAEAEAFAEALIGLLDAQDGDPDLEDEYEADPSDAEPSLGAIAALDQRCWSAGSGEDLEVDGWRRPRRHLIARATAPSVNGHMAFLRLGAIDGGAA